MMDATTNVPLDAVNYLLWSAGKKLEGLDEYGVRLHRLFAEGLARDPDRTGEYGAIEQKELEKALVRDHGASRETVAKARRMGLLDSRADRRARSKLADKILGSADSTEDLYRDPETGKWDPERKALHDSIIDTMLRRKKKVPASGIDPETGLKRQSLEWDPEGEYIEPPSGKPTLLMTAGGNAVGKSSVLFTNAKQMYPEDAIHIDFDEIKKMLPEFQQFAEARDIYGTDAVHFESAAIAKRLTETARRMGHNIVIDASGDGSGDQFERTLARFKKSGYDIDVVMADAPLGLAVKSMIERGDGNGRYVPLPIMYRIHRNSVAQFEKWQKNEYIRHFEVWRREVAGGGPEDFKLVANGGGGKTTVVNKAMYKRLRRKARRGLTTRDIGRRD
jgi:Zeta toxin